jgi:hypothetical protein
LGGLCFGGVARSRESRARARSSRRRRRVTLIDIVGNGKALVVAVVRVERVERHGW